MSSVATAVVGIPLVYLLSRAFKVRPKPITIANPRKEATLTFLVVLAVFVAILAWRAIIIPTFEIDLTHIDAVDILWIAIASAIFLLPVTAAMKSTGQNLGSIGIDGKDLGRMLALVFSFGAIYVGMSGFLAPSLGGSFVGFSPSLAYGFIYYAIISSCEEIIWRGYVQTRLVAHSGTLKGYVGTSLIETFFWHFTVRYFRFSGAALEALASALLILPISLLFGYIMLRCQNIIPPSIFHLFYNWSGTLWQIPVS